MNLTSENVEATFLSLLFKEGEDPATAVIVEGCLCKFGFHPERLKEQSANIAGMLDELPDSFKQRIGGGMSFLQACENRDGVQWTGLHATMDHLMAMGIAAGLAQYIMPREMWRILPGGMPYFVVLHQDETLKKVIQ